MWIDMAFRYKCRFAVLPYVLLYYRIHGNQITSRDKNMLIAKDKEIVAIVSEILNINLSNMEKDIICKCRQENHMSLFEIWYCRKVLSRLKKCIPQEVSGKRMSFCYNKGMLKCLLTNNMR